MKTFFATFGVNGPFKNKFVCISAESYEVARAAMIEMFDRKWAFVYSVYHSDPELGLEEQMQKHHLSPLFHVRVLNHSPIANDMSQLDIKLISEHEFMLTVQLDSEKVMIMKSPRPGRAVGATNPQTWPREHSLRGSNINQEV